MARLLRSRRGTVGIKLYSPAVLVAQPKRPARLTATGYRMLPALSLDAGGANSYEDLLRRAQVPGKGGPQAIRSAVSKLRRKLGDDARDPRYILGERGMGYRMPEPDQP